MRATAINDILKVLSNERRFLIVQWLKDPLAHFPPQQDGDLVEDGVCVGFITNKLGISQPSVTVHMRVLEDAGLVTAKQIKNWVFYKLNASLLNQFVLALRDKFET